MRQLTWFLEREAGQIVVCFALILLGLVMYKLNFPKAEDMLPFALGMLARSILGNGKTGALPDAGRSLRTR